MRRLELSVPWDVKSTWPETIALPILLCIAGFALIGLELSLVLRALPSMRLLWWSLPIGALVLVLGVYLGTLENYLSLPPSIRVGEVLVLLAGGGLVAANGAHHVGDVLLTLGVVMGAWVLGMNMAFHLQWLWPRVVVPPTLAGGYLEEAADRANARWEAEGATRGDRAASGLREFVIRLVKVFLGSLLMSSLARPHVAEGAAHKLAAAGCMAVLAASLAGSIAVLSLVEARRVVRGGSVRGAEGFERGWLMGLGTIVLSGCIAAVLLPAGIAPTASPDFGGAGAKVSQFMSSVTNVIGRAMFAVPAPVPQVGPAASAGSDKFRALVQAVFAYFTYLISNPFVGGRLSSASAVVAAITAMCALALAAAILWLLASAIISVVNFLRTDKLKLPVFPWRLIVSLLLWPVGLYRVLRWALNALSGMLASWLSGARERRSGGAGGGGGGVLGLFRLYARAAREIPKDPAGFIRFVLERVVAIARRNAAPGSQGATAQEYAAHLWRRFPATRGDLNQIVVAYERVRYGAKGADEASARSVGRAFAELRKGLRKAKAPDNIDDGVDL